jgi:apolipoprotein N-acyltransferase
MASPEITVADPGLFKALPRPVPAPAPVFPRVRLLPVLLALTTSGLLYLCYFPVAWGWLGWLALVPWLGLVRSRARPALLYSVSAFVGLLFFVPVLQWMRVADMRMYFTWVMLAIYCACYFPLALYLLRWVDRRTSLPLVVTLPVVWTALEFLRAHLFTGFPWYFLAHTQHDFLPLIQISDITGAYGVSFLVAAANALLFEALWQRKGFRSWHGPELPPRQSRVALLAQGLLAAVAFGGVLVYGVWRLSQDAQTPGPRLALLQGNVSQQVRNGNAPPPGEEKMTPARHYIGLCDVAQAFSPEMIVWPETSFYLNWRELAPDHSGQGISNNWMDDLRFQFVETRYMNRRWPTPMLLGLDVEILAPNNKSRSYNSALLLAPTGEVLGRYDKIHRVPFGEYVPLKEMIPGMKYFAPYDFDYEVSAGSRHPQLPLVGRDQRCYTFGSTICYEDSDPIVGRPYGKQGGPSKVDFVVNISNDGWFDGTAEHEQHLAICRFRAVECRQSVARSVNMGISGVIDGNGRVLRPHPLPQPDFLGLLAVSPAGGGIAALPWKPLSHYRPGVKVWSIPAQAGELPVSQWHEFKKVPGVLLATIPIDHRSSVYAWAGDWLPWGCWGLLGLTVGWASLWRTRRNSV